MYQKLTAWSVHLFTASGALLALWALLLIAEGNIRGPLLILALAVFIDAVDGTLARRANVEIYAPQVDGALLDNIVDYLTWVFLPVVWTYAFLEIPFLVGAAVLITSLFGFTHKQAKTDDHFFRGFPSYWIIVILYLYVLGAGPWISSVVLLLLALLVLAPVKFIYPSRTRRWQTVTVALFIPYALLLLVMMIYLDETPLIITLASFYYPIYYVAASAVLTQSPGR